MGLREIRRCVYALSIKVPRSLKFFHSDPFKTHLQVPFISTNFRE